MMTDSAISNRKLPRLWVETLWILDSLDTSQPIREVPLRRGLNLVVSPPRGGSVGHGVGKTAFCQLLRFVLDDPDWSTGSALRDELLHTFPEGAVAARVHVGGETWTVLKLWRHQRQNRASRHATWRQLADNEVENEYGVYSAVLTRTLVDPLPIKQLPGSEQPIQWPHILAWCSRDQNARYQGYFKWRAKGAGFRLPAKSPPYLVKAVLGLLRDDAMLQQIEQQEQEVSRLTSELASLREEPTRMLLLARQQLARQLDVTGDTPFRRRDLLDEQNLLDRARQRKQGYAQELATLGDRVTELDRERDQLVGRCAPIRENIELLENEIAQYEALKQNNMDRVRELQQEAKSLQHRQDTMCDLGHRLLRDCQYVETRIELVQIDRARGARKYSDDIKTIDAELAKAKTALATWQEACIPLDQQAQDLEAQREHLLSRRASIIADDRRLQEAIAAYESYEPVAMGYAPHKDAEELEERLHASKAQLARLWGKQNEDSDEFAERLRSISGRMQALADQLPAFSWGRFRDDEQAKSRPFQLGPQTSTTFRVLETLTGDVACLLDSVDAGSFHPGFLLHDSPREAEMSEAIFWALITQMRGDDPEGFQYLVTTSTDAPAKLNEFVRLTLDSSDESGYLFRTRIGTETRSLSLS